jgi:hypothetical protein
MSIDDVKYGVMFNCAFVIDLIVIPCFCINVEFFNCIRVFSFLSLCIISIISLMGPME